MKKTIYLLLLIYSTQIFAQEYTFQLPKNYMSQFGDETDLVNFIPLFRWSSDTLHNKQKSLKLDKLPEAFDSSKAAYGFISFSGLKDSSFDNEIAIIVEDYSSLNPTIYIDRNGNLDFSDDGLPTLIDGSVLIVLKNELIDSAFFYQRISNSKVSEANQSRITNRFKSRFPKGDILPANNWLTTSKLMIRVHKTRLNGKPITLLLKDGFGDGAFTFQTDELGDRVLILEGEMNTKNDMTSLLRQSEPIDHNAVFALHGENYFIKKVAQDGSNVTIAVTNKDTRVMFGDGANISAFRFSLIDGEEKTVKELIKDRPYLLLDIGGTWCGGCIQQQPRIQKLYRNQKMEVIGLFDFDTPESVKRYVKSHKIEWPVSIVNTEFKEMFRVTSFPTYILISPEGRIVYADTSAEKIESFLSSKN